jgi:hypothetical protein
VVIGMGVAPAHGEVAGCRVVRPRTPPSLSAWVVTRQQNAAAASPRAVGWAAACTVLAQHPREPTHGTWGASVNCFSSSASRAAEQRERGSTHLLYVRLSPRSTRPPVPGTARQRVRRRAVFVFRLRAGVGVWVSPAVLSSLRYGVIAGTRRCSCVVCSVSPLTRTTRWVRFGLERLDSERAAARWKRTDHADTVHAHHRGENRAPSTKQGAV